MATDPDTLRDRVSGEHGDGSDGDDCARAGQRRERDALEDAVDTECAGRYADTESPV